MLCTKKKEKSDVVMRRKKRETIDDPNMEVDMNNVT